MHSGTPPPTTPSVRPTGVGGVDEKRMSTTRNGEGIFLHCLPVRRNVVVTDGVLDGAWSRVTDQAENRLHVQRAVLETILKYGGSR